MNQVLEQFLAAVQATALDHTIAFEETKRDPAHCQELRWYAKCVLFRA